MRTSSFETTLRHIAFLSLGVPLVASQAGCGGRAGDPAEDHPACSLTEDGGCETPAQEDAGCVLGFDGACAPPTPAPAPATGDAGACSTVGSPPPDMGGCGWSFTLPLEGSPQACGFVAGAGILIGPESVCYELCRVATDAYVDCSITPNSDGMQVQCSSGCPLGRRPEGLVELDPSAGGDLGAYFARAAWLEAASVDAFEILQEELLAHGAPARLVRAARRAARDEVRHAAMMTTMARRYGASPRRPDITRRAARSLEEIAIENAVEGCVGETFAAAMAIHQAARARSPLVRRVMARIARDESRHAALGWAVAAWANERLSPAALARVADARRVAVQALERDARGNLPSAFAAELGLPSPEQSARLLEAMNSILWHPSRAARYAA